MADKEVTLIYTICPGCGGSGRLDSTNPVPGDPQTVSICSRCLDERPPFGTKVFGKLRHVYTGRLEKVKEISAGQLEEVEVN
jgi:hypothetical protein